MNSPNRPVRSFRPRSRSSVTERNMTPAKGSGRKGVYSSEHFLNPDITNVRFMRPACYQKGCTIIRIWPLLDPEAPTTNLLSGRQNAMGPAGLTGMAMSEPVTIVDFAGLTDKNAMGLVPQGQRTDTVGYIESRGDNKQVEGIGFWDLPYVSLWQALSNAHKTGRFANGGAWNASWNPFFGSQQTPLPRFKTVYFAFVSVVENGPNLNLEREIVTTGRGAQKTEKIVPRDGVPYGLKPSDELVIMPLAVSAGSKLLELTCREKPHYTGNPNTPETCNIPFVYGDPCGKFNPATGELSGGLFYTIYNPKKYTFQGHADHTTFKGELKDVQDYSVGVSRSVMGPNGKLSASMTPEETQQIFDKSLYMWRDSPEDRADSYALHQPSIEERCVWIAKAFKYLPELLRFGWQDKPDYLEFPEVAKIVNAEVSVRVPKGSAAYETTQQQQQHRQSPGQNQPAADEFEDEFSDSTAEPPATTRATGNKNMPGLKTQVTAKTTTTTKPAAPSAAELAAEFDDVSEELPLEAESDEFDTAPQAELEVYDEFDDAESPDEAFAEEDGDAVSDEFSDEEPPEVDPLQANVAMAKAVARSQGRSQPGGGSKPPKK